MKDIERFRMLLDFKETNPNELSKRLNLSRAQGLYDILSGKTGISKKMAANLCGLYPDVNATWLLTGEGSMLKNEDARLVVSSSVSRIPENKLVPLYDFQTARDLMSGRVPTAMDYIYIPNISDCDGALYVRTNSMSPRIQTGDVVLFKMLHSKTGSYTINSFRWGDVYLILFCMNGDSSVVLKHIQKSDDDTLVKLANFDKKVDSYEIPIDSIKSLALVKGGVFYMAM